MVLTQAEYKELEKLCIRLGVSPSIIDWAKDYLENTVAIRKAAKKLRIYEAKEIIKPEFKFKGATNLEIVKGRIAQIRELIGQLFHKKKIDYFEFKELVEKVDGLEEFLEERPVL